VLVKTTEIKYQLKGFLPVGVRGSHSDDDVSLTILFSILIDLPSLYLLFMLVHGCDTFLLASAGRFTKGENITRLKNQFMGFSKIMPFN